MSSSTISKPGTNGATAQRSCVRSAAREAAPVILFVVAATLGSAMVVLFARNANVSDAVRVSLYVGGALGIGIAVFRTYSRANAKRHARLVAARPARFDDSASLPAGSRTRRGAKDRTPHCAAQRHVAVNQHIRCAAVGAAQRRDGALLAARTRARGCRNSKQAGRAAFGATTAGLARGGASRCYTRLSK